MRGFGAWGEPVRPLGVVASEERVDPLAGDSVAGGSFGDGEALVADGSDDDDVFRFHVSSCSVRGVIDDATHRSTVTRVGV